MKLKELNESPIYTIETDKSSAQEIKVEIEQTLKGAPIGATCVYKTKKVVMIGTKIDKGIKISKS
jgi:hypothetical protein